ncbi:MAG: hypothetical protein WCS42_26285, partial [Verrucomicrobiota bacterium]
MTKFNKDFRIQLYRLVTVNNQTVARLTGMVGETCVTILFDDQNPPAGSVDELYNADFNEGLALTPAKVPVTTPQNNPNPGASGQVNGLAVLSNDETLVVGQFPSYNGFGRNCIALVNTDGSLDTAFDPGSGADNFINSVALTAGNQIVIGGGFLSFNGTQRNGIARLNLNGSLDTTFNPGLGADGIVRVVAAQPDGKVLIGGEFKHINGTPRNYLARLNTDGSLDTTFDPGATFSGPVHALALPAIFKFSNASRGRTNQVVQVINLGTAVAGNLTINYNLFGQTNQMQIFYGDTNGVLLVDTGVTSLSGGTTLPFGPVNGFATNLITIVMNPGGSQSGTTWSYSGSISSIAAGTVMVGGAFAVAGQNYLNIARVNTTDGSLDTTFIPGTGPDSTVLALGSQLDGKIVLGGAFTKISGTKLNRLARLNADGSIDTVSFFPGTGADDTVYNLLSQIDGSLYVGGAFTSFNGTHRLGFTRLYADGTVDTTFLDTAYNQFAGLKRIYSYDAPKVLAAGIQSDGNVMIGGSFYQVGGGQADTNVCNILDAELGIGESFANPNIYVEPKSRDGVRNRNNVARLIGGTTPGPGNISLMQKTYSANKSQAALSVSLVRTNGTLGPVSANFSVATNTALIGVDYTYSGTPPLFWIAWEYLVNPTRMHSDG